MARRSVEQEMAALTELSRQPDRADAREMLAAGLASKTNFVIGRAADVAAKLERKDLAGEILAAGERLLPDAPKLDKGCVALTAIAKALYQFGDPLAEPLFLKGIKHVQMEGSFGPPVDAAAELRGQSALGLVRLAYRDVMLHLVDLLDDPWPQARSFAARALAYSERPEAGLLLRFKLLKGDMEFGVMSECMSALVRFRQHDLVEFLGRFLEHEEPEVRTSAALALGETRQADAIDALRDHFAREPDSDTRRAVLLGLAMLRLPQAMAWLIGIIESSSARDAADAIEAMALYRRDAVIADRVRTAAKARKEPGVQRALAKHFDS